MISEARLRANRLNAQKSTGPRTPEGKARSRRNALKHGLAGDGIVLPVEDEALIAERLPGWTASLEPTDEAEAFLVARAVLATVRMDRCARKDLADSAKRRRKAIDGWLDRQERQVALWAGRLAQQPAEAVAHLEDCVTGCDWLTERWEELAAALDDPGSWDDAQEQMAVRLLGLAVGDRDDRAASERMNALAARPDLDPNEIDAFFGSDTRALEPQARLEASEARLPEPDAARAELRKLTRDERDRLAALRAALWEEQDGPDLAEAISSAGVEDEVTDRLRHRYETAAERELHRSLEQIDRRRREKDKARQRGSQLAPPRPRNPSPRPSWAVRPEPEPAPAPAVRVEPNAAQPLEEKPCPPTTSDGQAGPRACDGLVHPIPVQDEPDGAGADRAYAVPMIPLGGPSETSGGPLGGLSGPIFVPQGVLLAPMAGREP